MRIFRQCLRSIAAAGFVCTLVSCGTAELRPPGLVRNVNDAAFAGGEISILSFNMLHGFADRLNSRTVTGRLQRLEDTIVEVEPDVVLLQEASATPERRYGNVVDRLVSAVNARVSSSGISYNAVFVPAHGSRLIGFFEGSAILSRFAIQDVDVMRYQAQAWWPPESRIAVRATLIGTADLQVVSTHLTNRDAARRGTSVRLLQAGELASWLRQQGGTPTIVGGDFNAPPDDAAVRAMLNAGAIDSSAWFSSVKPTSLRGSVTDPSSVFTRRIDYVFVYGEALVTGVRRVLDWPSPDEVWGYLWPSDHAGVFVTMQIGSPDLR